LRQSSRSVLDHSLPVVQASANKLLSTFGSDVVRNPGYRQALIEASIITNAALAAHSIQQEFEANEQTEIRAVYGVYLLETREVWAPRLGAIGLAPAPRDLAGFVELGNAVVESDRIASHLTPKE
jgi:carbonic anhydrase